MLYVIHGTDTRKTRKKLQNLTETLQKKRPEAVVFRMNQDNWNPALLQEMLSGINLFAPKNIIILDSLVSIKDTSEYIEEQIDELSKSEHLCILFEQKINTALLKKLEKKAEKIEEHNELERTKKESPKTFELADALIEKDKVKAWTTFISIKEQDIPAEEIHVVLWWQFKSLKLVSDSRDQKESELNPYVYQKCKRALSKWGTEELDAYLENLVRIYHNAHKGELDLYKELEVLCLV